MSEDSNLHDACDAGACFVPTDRRRFLRDSLLRVAGALMAVGASRTVAFAMPLELTAGTRLAKSTIAYAIPSADGAQIDRENEVILVRWQNAVYAFNLSCPHQNTALRWDEQDRGFQCPKHHSRFQLDGEYIAGSGRATRNMDRFLIVRDGAQVRVDVDKLCQNDTDPSLWAAAVVKLA